MTRKVLIFAMALVLLVGMIPVTAFAASDFKTSDAGIDLIKDFEGFYNNEIIIRKALVYPPYCDMCILSFNGQNEVNVFNCSKAFLSAIQNSVEYKYKNQKVIVLGPLPARIAKISNKYRYRIIIKCKNNKLFREMISDLLITFGKDKKFSDVSVSADINPENLL